MGAMMGSPMGAMMGSPMGAMMGSPGAMPMPAFGGVMGLMAPQMQHAQMQHMIMMQQQMQEQMRRYQEQMQMQMAGMSVQSPHGRRLPTPRRARASPRRDCDESSTSSRTTPTTRSWA